MKAQEILGALFVLGVGFFAVLAAAMFVVKHPRICGAYVAGLAVLAVAGAIVGGPNAFGTVLIFGLVLPPTAAIMGGIWVAYSKPKPNP
jgi:hypothetical protein